MKLSPKNQASDLKIAIIHSKWNEYVVKALVDGAVETLEQAGAKEPLIVQVAGAWEIPLAAKTLIESGKFDGVIALGCVLRGQTTHAQLLASDVSSALMNLQMASGKPISWGILTPDTEEQAISRAGMKHGNKGREAAGSLLELIATIRAIQKL